MHPPIITPSHHYFSDIPAAVLRHPVPKLIDDDLLLDEDFLPAYASLSRSLCLRVRCTMDLDYLPPLNSPQWAFGLDDPFPFPDTALPMLSAIFIDIKCDDATHEPYRAPLMRSMLDKIRSSKPPCTAKVFEEYSNDTFLAVASELRAASEAEQAADDDGDGDGTARATS